MRKVAFGLLLLVACVSVLACGGAAAENATPEGLIKVQTAALAAMDGEKMSAWFVPEERAEMKKNLEEMFKKLKEAGFVSVSGKFGAVKVEGDTATVEMEMLGKDKDGKEKQIAEARPGKMVKKDGLWWSKK